MKKILVTSLLAGLLCSFTASADTRPVGFHGIGPRVGFTINPDQIHFGGHIDFGDLADNFMMLPNLEIGFGDNLTTIIGSALTGVSGRHILAAELGQYSIPPSTAVAGPNWVCTCSLESGKDRPAVNRVTSSSKASLAWPTPPISEAPLVGPSDIRSCTRNQEKEVTS
jgi:hypothetical protein